MYGDIMEKSVVRQNLKSRNYFKNTLDKLKNLNKTKIFFYLGQFLSHLKSNFAPKINRYED